MTTPIQEPASGRDVQNLKWGRDQLFRRPRPPQNTFSTCRLANESYQITVAHLSPANLDFDSWENNDTDVFDVVTSGGRARNVNLMQIGMYSINVRVSWEGGAGFAGEPDLTTIILNDDYVNPDVVTLGQTYENQPGAYIMTVNRSYPIFMNPDITETSTPPYGTVLLQLNQSSPGSISQTTNAFMETSAEIWYWNMPYDFTPTYPP